MIVDNYAEWIGSLLGMVNHISDSDREKLFNGTGRGCAIRNNHFEAIKIMKEAASYCQTRSDYVEFFKKQMPPSVKIIEDKDGIIMCLGKEKCTCPMAPDVASHVLCNCTRGHEKAVWSEFFGKQIDVELLETHLRGGSDCVIKILV